MQVQFNKKGTTLIVHISGELDHHYADYTRQKIDSELYKATTKNLVFDFSALEFMDSSGIGVIAGRYKNIKKLNGNAAIVSNRAQINRILEMSGIQQIMKIYDSVELAVTGVQAG